MLKGIVPSTNFISPLQSDITNVGYREVIGKVNKVNSDPMTQIKHQLFDVKSKSRLFAFDKHNFTPPKGKTKEGYLHINIKEPQNANKIQNTIYKSLNEKEVSKNIYNTFENFDKVGKVIKKGGKAIAAISVTLDVLELGTTIKNDLNDKDKRLGKKTIKASAGIGVSWAGGIGGAKLGAMGGASIGTLICPGLGTVIGGFIGGIGGGIVGSLSGRALGEFAVDSLYKGE